MRLRVDVGLRRDKAKLRGLPLYWVYHRCHGGVGKSEKHHQVDAKNAKSLGVRSKN